MRKLIFFISASFLFSCNGTSRKKSDLYLENLKGKVSVVRQTTYEAEEKFGEVEKGRIKLKSVVKYNKSGFIEESLEYDSYGELKAKSLFKYDDNGRLIEQNNYDGYGKLYTKQKCAYNDKGVLESQTIYNSDGDMDGKFIFKYDENRNMNEFSVADNSGEIKMLTKQVNDKRGFPVEMEIFESNTLRYKDSYAYDKEYNRITSIRYNADGGLKDKMTFKYVSYDKKGNWLIQYEFIDEKPIKINERAIEYY